MKWDQQPFVFFGRRKPIAKYPPLLSAPKKGLFMGAGPLLGWGWGLSHSRGGHCEVWNASFVVTLKLPGPGEKGWRRQTLNIPGLRLCRACHSPRLKNGYTWTLLGTCMSGKARRAAWQRKTNRTSESVFGFCSRILTL